jgi:hypothetical protein
MAAKLPKAITDMQLTAVRTLTSILPAPALSAVAAGSVATLSWTPPLPTGQSVIAGYRLYRGATAGSQTTLVGTFTTTSTTDTLSGTQYYRIEAFDQYQTGISSTSVQCIPGATSSVRWAPGHWAESDTVIFASGGSVATVKGEAAQVTDVLANIRGFLILITWGAIEPIQGDISQGISYIDQVLTSLPASKNFMVLVEVGAFTQTHAGTNDFSIVPAYIQQNVSLYGQAGYRVGGITTQPSGVSGWWGGEGNGNTYAAQLFRPNVNAAFTNACALLCAHYAPNPRFHGIVYGENSFCIGAGTTNGVSGYSDTQMTLMQQNWCNAMLAAAPQISVIFENTFMFASGPTQDFENWMIDNRVAPGCSDSFGLTYSNAHGGAPFNWGLQAMCGFQVGSPTTTIRDRRSECRAMCEIQATDMGFFGQNNYSPQDILNGLNQVTRATHAFWALVPNNISGNQSPAANWPQLGPFLNANPLTNSSYPPNYPALLAAPTEVLLVNQGGANVSTDLSPGLTNTAVQVIQWTPVSSATGGYDIERTQLGQSPSTIALGVQPTTFQGYIAGTTLTVIAAGLNGTVHPNVRYTAPGILQETMIDARQLSGTTGGAGTYHVNRSQTLGSAGAPVLFSACQYIDTTATNSSRPAFDGPTTSYSYKVTAIDSNGVRGTKSSTMQTYIYRKGLSNTNNADLSFGTITENYASTSGSPQGGPFAAQIIANHGGFQPSMDNMVSPKWTMGLGFARYLIFDINPGATYTGWKINTGVVRRMIAGDVFGTAPQLNGFSFPLIPGTVPQVNTWMTCKVPINPQQLGHGTFPIAGSISGSTLTVSSVGVDPFGVAGKLDNSGYITGTGIPAGYWIHAVLSATTFEVYGPSNTPASLSVSSTGQNWTWTGYDMYKFLIMPDDPAQPITYYLNNIGFSN